MKQIYTDSNGVTATASSNKPAGHFYDIVAGEHKVTLRFQSGGVEDKGVNGITNEALLAVLEDRLTHLNNKFPCIQNNLAIINIKAALTILEQRTASREARGVEQRRIAAASREEFQSDGDI